MNTKHLMSIIRFFYKGGIRKDTPADDARTIEIANVFFLLCIFSLILVIAINLIDRTYSFMLPLNIALAAFFALAMYQRITGNHEPVSYITLSFCLFFTLFVVFSGGNDANSGHIWAFLLPPMMTFAFGMRKGATIVFLHIVVTSAVFFSPLDAYMRAEYSMGFRIRFTIAFFMCSIFSIGVEYFRQLAQQKSELLLKKQEESMQQRLNLEEQLRQSQKMEAVGRLAGGIAHDFNNIITGILSYSSLIRNNLPEHGDTRSDIDTVIEAAHRALGLTSQLLAFSRKQIIELKVLDIGVIIESMSMMLGRTIAANISIQKNKDIDTGSIKGNPNQIEQIIMNLMVNARDSMPSGGLLSISCGNVTIEEKVSKLVMDYPPGDYVYLRISDTGCGMDKATIEKAFEPFFTTKKLGQGTGLGLAVVYGIVKQNDYLVNLESEVNKGTTVEVLFSRTYQPLSSSVAPSHAAFDVGTKNILLVEDESIVLKSTSRLLKQYKYNVLEASSGEQALEVVRQFDGPIHLLITDIVMTGMSGKELSEKLCVDRPSTKVLFMSGYTQDIIFDEGIIDSDTNFLSKPFTTEDLSDIIHNILS